MSPIWLVIHPEAELCELLRAYGAPAEIASSSTVGEALNTCCALEPACVVASAKISDQDARWIVSAIRAQSEIASVPIIVFSEGDERARVALLKKGADVVLNAPISTAGILTSIEAVIALCDRMRDAQPSRRESPRSGAATPRAGSDTKPIPAQPRATVLPPTTRRPAGSNKTLRAGLAALKPLVFGPETPMHGTDVKALRKETLHSQQAVGPASEGPRSREPAIPVEEPSQPWLPQKKSRSSESTSRKTVRPAAAEAPSTRRPR